MRRRGRATPPGVTVLPRPESPLVGCGGGPLGRLSGHLGIVGNFREYPDRPGPYTTPKLWGRPRGSEGQA